MTKLITIDYEEYLKLKENEKQIKIKVYEEQIKLLEDFKRNQYCNDDMSKFLNVLKDYYRNLIIQKGDEE